MNDETLIFFNNCKGQDHETIYDDERAFYDLGIGGSQGKKADDLLVGQECVVVHNTNPETNEVMFTWHSLTDVYEAVDNQMRLDCRVFAGDFLHYEILNRDFAIEHPIYKTFFDKLGRYKQQVVLKRIVPFSERPTFQIPRSTGLPEEVASTDTKKLPEGATYTITINAYERNVEARRECIEHFGAICSVCDFSFEETYGDFAADYIHVHHLKPLSEIGKQYSVNPKRDLRPVCPNCHAMIHLGGENRTIAKMKRIIQQQSAK